MAISARNQTLFSLKLVRHLGSVLGNGGLLMALALATACYGEETGVPADDDDDNQADGDDDDDGDDDGDDDDDDSDDDDDNATSSQDTETTTEHAAFSVTIKATLLDPEGEPINMQQARVCAAGHGAEGGCKRFSADQILEDGKVEAKFDLVAGHYDFLVGSDDRERHFSQTPSLAVVEKDGVLDFGDVYIPEAKELREIATSGSTTLEIDDKLTLDITGEGMWNCDQVGGIAIQEEQMPPSFKEQIPGEVLSVWAFVHYGACEIKISSEGKTVGVTIHDSFGLEPGEKVDVYQVDWGTGEPIKLTSATVDDEGKAIATKTDDGLTRLTWLAIVKPE